MEHSPERKVYARCRDEVLELETRAPASVVSRIKEALAIVTEGEKLEAVGRLRDASVKYDDALALIPNMQCAKEHLFVFKNVFQSPSVISLGREMRRNDRLSFDGYLSVIWSALKNRDLNTGREFFREAYQKRSGDPGTLLYMEALLNAVDDNTSTLKEKLQRAHKLSPSLVLPLISLSRIQRLDGDQISANAFAHEAVTAAKRNLLSSDQGNTAGFWSTIPERYLHLAMALYEASYNDRTLLKAAYEALNAALTLEPDLPGGDVYMTSILIDLNENDAALEYSSHIKLSVPYSAWMHFQRSRAYLYSRKTEQAQSELALSHRAQLGSKWIRWFTAVIDGEELPLEHDVLSIFPFTSESVIPPLLTQFNRSHSLRGDHFSELSEELFHINRKVRHAAADRIVSYSTEAGAQALKPFLLRYRKEITEDLLTDSRFSHAGMLLQFVHDLTPEEVARVQQVINSDGSANLSMALQIVYTHGTESAGLVTTLRSSLKRPLLVDGEQEAFVKAVNAIPTAEAEKLLIEVADMKDGGKMREYAVEVLQYRSLTNPAIDEYL